MSSGKAHAGQRVRSHRRRDLVAMLGGAVVAWPLAARAQASVPTATVAWLSAVDLKHSAALPYLLKGLSQAGFVVGRTLAIEDESAEGSADQFPSRAADAVRKQVSLIAAVSGLPSIKAAKAATSLIPIVAISQGDPVELGLIASLNRPGGNITGVGGIGAFMVAKQVELLNEVVPGNAPLALLLDPTSEAEMYQTSANAAARTLGRRMVTVTAPGEPDFEPAFRAAARQKAAGIVVTSQPIFNSIYHRRLAELAARFEIPAMYDWQDLAKSGGLMSYGTSIFDLFEQAGLLAGRILSGAKPADIPFERPRKIELKINLKTAKSLAVSVPESILVRADEVIE